MYLHDSHSVYLISGKASKSAVSIPVLGDVKFNWDVSCREADFMRWKKNVHRNFKTNINTERKSQAAFFGIG